MAQVLLRFPPQVCDVASTRRNGLTSNDYGVTWLAARASWGRASRRANMWAHNTRRESSRQSSDARGESDINDRTVRRQAKLTERNTSRRSAAAGAVKCASTPAQLSAHDAHDLHPTTRGQRHVVAQAHVQCSREHPSVLQSVPFLPTPYHQSGDVIITIMDHGQQLMPAGLSWVPLGAARKPPVGVFCLLEICSTQKLLLPGSPHRAHQALRMTSSSSAGA